ncbi:penicillin-binding protein [Cuneatibacter sp. NSJ-177]|uniref:penicillin-binding transpeptidase domain-containing protein n=1 Tax=Cuneatibacter sp. NSJ-177 TaxID=2931401 RepID=UPI001FD4D3BE|nr:penicillin-binding transpeptidase domain-containing protein [Cuneatibacter sp. NSJ-177]MCJ7836439.1 penicillin-binding protein [Cuneatibacter sp. NSJ-177]
MFRDLLEYLGYKIKKIATSRLFPLCILFILMFGALVYKLFQLQIIEGADKQEEYISQKTQRTISLPSTRGNIYDRNGNLLAYNQLVYTVTLTDTGDYSDGYAKNLMLLDLIGILDKYGETILTEVPIVIDSNGEFQFTASDSARLRFLRDMYGKKSVEELQSDTSGKVDVNISARGVFDYLYEKYGIGYKNAKKKPEEMYMLDNETALKLINIRYSLAANAFQRYRSITIASDIQMTTMSDILEHSDSLKGVAIEEEYVRLYNDSEYFAQVLGYTGKANTEQITSLNEEAGSERYSLGDVVGQSGIEETMEQELQGTKGQRTMYLDSLGHVLEITSETEPKTGNDVHLTIDRDLTIGIYHMIEQRLAGILEEKLVNEKFHVTPKMGSTTRKQSIYDVYFQLINNNILDTNHFSEDDASAAEQRIYQAFQSGQARVLSALKAELLSESPTPYKDLDADKADSEKFMQIYMSYVYTILDDAGYLLKDNIDTADKTYIAYKTDETISLKEFLQYALAQNWIDVSKLPLDSKYTSAEETYRILVDTIEELAKSSPKFSKKIYQNLIMDDAISGCDLCLALIDQGVLDKNEDEIASLETQTPSASFDFIKDKIHNLELTPAQLALDPHSAAVTVTDVNTGAVLAVVSYPSYDNNKLSGTVDSDYYYKLTNDLSSPLYNGATQAQTAPGSVFKPITAVAALESGVIKADDIIDTKGVFTEVGLNLSCWYMTSTGNPHGPLDMVGAIRGSCNYYFSELGFLLSKDENGNYNEPLGLSAIQKFASAFGLDRKSGIEIKEKEPHISDTAPVPSAIGQGTHLFSNVQLARYLNALANSGTVYNLTLLDEITDTEGNIVKEYEPTIANTTDFAASTWSTVHQGMYEVLNSDGSSAHRSFTASVTAAGKTGTAEENKLRPNHANFISYAPSDNPEIGVTVTIPYGYTSARAVELASDVYKYYYKEMTLDEIKERKAELSSNYVGD